MSILLTDENGVFHSKNRTLTAHLLRERQLRNLKSLNETYRRIRHICDRKLAKYADDISGRRLIEATTRGTLGDIQQIRFVVPDRIPGRPVYDIDYMTSRLVRDLRKDGYNVEDSPYGDVVISWYKPPKEYVEDLKRLKNNQAGAKWLDVLRKVAD